MQSEIVTFRDRVGPWVAFACVVVGVVLVFASPAAANATSSAASDGTAPIVCTWNAASAPPDGMRLHLLLDEPPYSVFGCGVRALFGVHRAVQVPLPPGRYLARLERADGTQQIASLHARADAADVPTLSVSVDGAVASSRTPRSDGLLDTAAVTHVCVREA